MVKHIRRCSAPLALVLALAAGACSRDKKEDALSQDSALNRDLQLANADSAAQPELKDVPPTAAPVTPEPTRRPTTPVRRPAATRPSTPAPAPRPETTATGNVVEKGTAGSEGRLGTVAAGTTVALRSASKICTNTNKVGDRFTATVAEAVTGSNGAVIPAGATAVIQVTSLKRSENANDDIVMGFSVVSLTVDGRTYNVNGSNVTAQVEKVRSTTRKDDAKKVAGGAIIGAIAGQVLGKDTKGTVIGAATGAAAGAAAAAATANFEGCVNDGARITFRLDEPLTIRAAD